MSTGQAQAAAAANHIKQAVNALAALVTKLDALQGATGGIEQDAKSAAGHLEGVAEVVGSKTAGELAAIVRASIDEINAAFTPNVTEALEACRDEARRLSAVFERAEELAQQLGA